MRLLFLSFILFFRYCGAMETQAPKKIYNLDATKKLANVLMPSTLEKLTCWILTEILEQPTPKKLSLLEQIRILIEEGADPNTPIMNGCIPNPWVYTMHNRVLSPISIALGFGSTELLSLLLIKGAGANQYHKEIEILLAYNANREYSMQLLTCGKVKIA